MIDISIFSGRCDLCDTIAIHGVDNILAKYKIYDQRHILPLAVNEAKDLIPYYPYLVAMMVSSQETGGMIYLSEESFVDREEKDQIQCDLDYLLRYWRRCKKNKKPFNEQEALKEITWFCKEPKEYQIELVRRVEARGDKASIEDLHDDMHDYYRKALFEEMVNNGWEKERAGSWVYGWLRWAKMKKQDENNKLLTS